MVKIPPSPILLRSILPPILLGLKGIKDAEDACNCAEFQLQYNGKRKYLSGLRAVSRRQGELTTRRVGGTGPPVQGGGGIQPSGTTVNPKSSDPFYIVTYHIIWVTTSRTYCIKKIHLSVSLPFSSALQCIYLSLSLRLLLHRLTVTG